MKRSLFLFLSLFTLSVSVLKADRYYFFDHITTRDGLPSNTIYCTMQDRMGFIWIGTRDGLSRYDGNSARDITYIANSGNIGGSVYAICEDTEGQIWFSSSSGINLFNPMTGALKNICTLDESACYCIAADGKGSVWMIAGDLIRFDCTTLENKPYLFEDIAPTSLAVDSFGTVWLSMSNGSLYAYDARTDRFEDRTWAKKVSKLSTAEDGKLLMATQEGEVLYLDCVTMDSEVLFKAGKGVDINCLIERTQGECWIGTSMGLYIRTSGSTSQGEAFHDASTPESISANYITSLGTDISGNVWVGTFYTGINLWKNRRGQMGIYFPNPSENSLKGRIVRSICQDGSGQLWLCTEDGWLSSFDPTNFVVKNFKLADNLNMQGLVVDGDRMWICSYGHGLWLFDIIHDKLIKHYDIENNMTTLGIKSADGTIFIGTTSGLYRYDRQDDSFHLVNSTSGDFVHSLYQDRNGIIWVGTYGHGIRLLSEDGTELGHHTQSAREGSLTSKFITSFYEDSRHRMWITTEGGGVCYTEPDVNIGKLHFYSLTTEDGLPSNVTCAIGEDNDGMMWISTTNGITCLSEENMKITGLVNASNELTGYQFSYGAICRTQSGVLYFGNTDGMVSLVPSNLKAKTQADNLHITYIQASNANRHIYLSEPGKSAMASQKVSVKHKDATSISIRFVAPEYTSRRPIYSYTLTKGKNTIITNTTYGNFVIFNGLRAGKYTFNIDLVGKEDGSDSEKSLEINILPHPLLSRTAFILYVLIFAAAITGFVALFHQKRKRDKARQMNKMVVKREKEIYNAKINFFTNITHEIRTPLSLIKMPIDKIIASGAYNSTNEKDLRIIQANTDRLLNLTNQILDMRKMERNEIRMSFIKEDLCAIVRKAHRLFEQMIQDQHISVITEMPDTPLYVMCAKDSILTIASNLISNAIKYGNGLINIKVSQSDDGQTAYVKVESNGERIPERDRENIFKIFFQREESEKGAQGTGLGLPYARTLANIHNGRLYIDESVTEMNSFVLEVPVNHPEQITIEQPATEKETETKLPEFDSSRHTVLIAEDSAEMRNYLANELSAEYNILTAANGADALEIVQKEKIDLVISDIMMPIMDGCELCNKIKSDSDLSHVPVILLTAAVGVENRIESLESGADGYIEKPFPIELLISNISNLFRNKEISYKQFISKPLTHYNSVTASKVDQDYMDKVHEFIMKHISEPDLNIENLTLQIGTSKSSLYRKLKANTGLSINEYIRLCRLKQAAELLSSQKYKINEVAFMTGFSSPSYFATCFLKQFNITPSEFVKNLGQ